jgi:hypothetical protein
MSAGKASYPLRSGSAEGGFYWLSGWGDVIKLTVLWCPGSKSRPNYSEFPSDGDSSSEEPRKRGRRINFRPGSENTTPEPGIGSKQSSRGRSNGTRGGRTGKGTAKKCPPTVVVVSGSDAESDFEPGSTTESEDHASREDASEGSDLKASKLPLKRKRERVAKGRSPSTAQSAAAAAKYKSSHGDL